jgi:methyl-accepting chemotaxis protein
VVGDIEKIVVDAQSNTKLGQEMREVVAGLVRRAQDFQAQVERDNRVFQRVAEQGRAFHEDVVEIREMADRQLDASEECSKAVEEQNKALKEISAATQELSALSEDLKGSTDTEKSAERVAAAAEQLSSSIEETSSSAALVLRSMVELTKGAEVFQDVTARGDAIARDVVSLMEEVTAGTDKDAREIRASLDILTDLSEQGKSFVQGIQDSLEAFRGSTDNVTALEEKGFRIGKTVDAIDRVAIQTNMLAVNGFIEAARSGEYGKGFSVVANDIRNLANESAENAERIKELVRAMQRQIALVASDLEDSGRRNRELVQTVQAGRKIRESVDEIHHRIRDLIASIQGKCGGTSGEVEVARHCVEEVSAAVQQSASAIEQSAKAAKEQARGMEELSKAIEEIAAIADELQSDGA